LLLVGAIAIAAVSVLFIITDYPDLILFDYSGYYTATAIPSISRDGSHKGRKIKVMNGTVFNIGYTDCGYTMAALVKHHPSSVIGAFWFPATVEDYNNLSCKWIDYVLEDNQAQAMLDDIDILDAEPHLYTHMVIVLTGNYNHPCDYSFVAGITRFFESR
ncbi:hypothetical protein, partial [Microcoleus sp. Pol12B4]|uniref:hypothetical protein n=1 Tax=Microcoleus sp. Pol12B4 TaxID=3055395 RepID=UPI002FD37E04